MAWRGFGMTSGKYGGVEALLRDDPGVSGTGVPNTTLEVERRPALILLLIFSALSLIFIVKSVALQYPSVIGDEYYYSILSRYFGQQDTLFAYNGSVPYYPNELYFCLFHSARWFGDNFYQFAKILNSLLFAAAIFPIYGLSRQFLAHLPALLLSILIIIAPFESYTAYFMPESCYFLGFWLFVFLFISNLPQRSLIAGVSGGFALGLLTLIKPHALAVLGGTNLTLVTVAFLPEAFELRLRDAIKCLAALNIMWLFTVATLHVVFFGHRDFDIFGFYRGYAQTPIPDLLAYTKHLIAVLFDNLAYIAPMFGLPILATFLAALGLLQADASESQSRFRILSLFAIIVWGFLLAMTGLASVVFAGADSTELARMLGRYYAFALPMFLITFYAVRGKPPENVRGPLFYGVLVCLALVLVGWRFLARVQPVNLTDYPEVAWVTRPHNIALSVFWPVAALVLIYYAIVGLRERTTYSIYLATAFIAGSILTFSAQRSLDFDQPADRAGALVRSLFDEKERDLGMVIGSKPWIVRRCLFSIQANPATLELPAGTVIDRLPIGKEVHWVLAFDDYDLRVPSTTLVEFAGIKVLRLQTATNRSVGQDSSDRKEYESAQNGWNPRRAP